MFTLSFCPLVGSFLLILVDGSLDHKILNDRTDANPFDLAEWIGIFLICKPYICSKKKYPIE